MVPQNKFVLKESFKLGLNHMLTYTDVLQQDTVLESDDFKTAMKDRKILGSHGSSRTTLALNNPMKSKKITPFRINLI